MALITSFPNLSFCSCLSGTAPVGRCAPADYSRITVDCCDGSSPCRGPFLQDTEVGNKACLSSCNVIGQHMMEGLDAAGDTVFIRERDVYCRGGAFVMINGEAPTCRCKSNLHQ